MEVQRMPDTCTGLHFYSFLHDVNWTDDMKSYIEAQKKAIKTQLDSAKLGRYVNVFAFLIGTQQKSKAQLEEFGFVCAADHHNYKYPDTSKRLYMMVKDMNDWEVKVEKKEAVNTFAAPVAAQPTAAAVDLSQYELAGHLRSHWDIERLIAHLMRYGVAAGRNVAIQDAIRNQYLIRRAAPAAPIAAPARVDRNQRIIDRRPIVSTHHGLHFAAERNGIRHRTLGMYNAISSRWEGEYVTPAGAIIDHPFPLNEWVDIPNEIVECPPALVGQNCEVRLHHGREEFYPARPDWLWNQVGENNQIVSVRRVP